MAKIKVESLAAGSVQIVGLLRVELHGEGTGGS